MVRKNERKGIIPLSEKNIFPLDSCVIPDFFKVTSFDVSDMQDKVESVLIMNGVIVDRAVKLAHDIAEDFPDESLHLLCVLKVLGNSIP